MDDSSNQRKLSPRISPTLEDHVLDLLLGVADADENGLIIFDRDLRVVAFNTKSVTFGLSLGMNSDGMLHRSLREIYPSIDDEIVEEFHEIFRTGATLVRTRQIQYGERAVWIESKKSPLRCCGKIAYLLLSIRNITELQHTKSALHEYEHRYSQLLREIPVGIFRSTPDGRMLSANPAMVRMYGYESEDAMQSIAAGSTYCDPGLRDELMIRLSAEGSVTGFESRHRRPDGEEIWVLSNMYAVRDEQGSVVYFEGIDQDITARKRAEVSLRESENLLRAIVEHSPLGISVRDRFGRLLFHNDSWLRIWNILPEDLEDYTTRERTSLQFDERDSYLGPWMEQVRAVYERGGYLRIPELDAREARKPRPLWLSQYFYALLDDSGEVGRVVILTEDITRHHEADDALRRSEEMNRLLLSHVPAVIALVDREGVFGFINDAGARALNRTAEQTVGKTMWELFPTDQADLQMENVRRVIDSGEAYAHEICTPVSGQWRWYWVNVQPFQNVDGSVNAAMVITVDINDRKIFEQELEASRDELERRVASRTAELAAANEELRLEREMLRQKNIALQEVLAQIEDGKRSMAAQIQANITRIAIPIVESMARRSDASSAHLVTLLRECLGNISAPLVSKLDKQSLSLSPRELQICHMIRSGLSSKQIAAAFDTSVLTVNKQRNQIRKKLGIAKEKVNLVSLLGRLENPTE